MKSDHWFYLIFRDSPELFFRLMHLPEAQAANYRFDAVELKAIALRLDGLFRPEIPGEPHYFLEAQLYKDVEFYRKWMAKIAIYNLQNRIEGEWRGLVLFGDRGHEPTPTQGVSEWSDSGRIQRVFLNELPEFPIASLDVAVLKLAVTKPEAVLEKARELAAVIVSERKSVHDSEKLLGMIAAFVIANFPRMTRKEIEAMLQLGDIRDSVVFQEVHEEGVQVGLQKGRREGWQEGHADAVSALVRRLASIGKSVQEICQMLELDEDRVKQTLAGKNL